MRGVSGHTICGLPFSTSYRCLAVSRPIISVGSTHVHLHTPEKVNLFVQCPVSRASLHSCFLCLIEPLLVSFSWPNCYMSVFVWIYKQCVINAVQLKHFMMLLLKSQAKLKIAFVTCQAKLLLVKHACTVDLCMLWLSDFMLFCD